MSESRKRVLEPMDAVQDNCARVDPPVGRNTAQVAGMGQQASTAPAAASGGRSVPNLASRSTTPHANNERASVSANDHPSLFPQVESAPVTLEQHLACFPESYQVSFDRSGHRIDPKFVLHCYHNQGCYLVMAPSDKEYNQDPHEGNKKLILKCKCGKIVDGRVDQAKLHYESRAHFGPRRGATAESLLEDMGNELLSMDIKELCEKAGIFPDDIEFFKSRGMSTHAAIRQAATTNVVMELISMGCSDEDIGLLTSPAFKCISFLQDFLKDLTESD